MTRFRGDTQSMTWNLTINGTEADLTTATSVEYAYNKDTASQVVIVGTITDASKGQVKFDVLDTDFDTKGSFTFDIQVVYNDDTKRTFIKDDLEIIDDVNKA